GSFNSANNCWNWVRTVASSSETKCLTGFDNGYAEIWSISASSSNTFPASVEYAGLKYRPNSGGSWTNWSSGGGTLYCFDGSAFKTVQNPDINNWNVAPGPGVNCSSNPAINHPLP